MVTVFFFSFLFSKTIFYFLRQKTCLVTYFRQKSKTTFNFHFVKETENWSWTIFIFSVFPHLRKHAKTCLENSQLMSKRTSSTHKTHKSIFPRFLFFSLNILAPNISDNPLSCFAPPLPLFCSQRKPWLREPLVR